MSRPDDNLEPALLHTGNRTLLMEGVWLQCVVLTMLASAAVQGWRVLALVAAVMVCFAGASSLCQWISLGARVETKFRWPTMSLLLAGLLPVHLAGGLTPSGEALWPVIPAAALLLALLESIRSRWGAIRFHPLLATLVILHVALGSLLQPTTVLQRNHALLGDVLSQPTEILPVVPWYRSDLLAETTALKSASGAYLMESYLRGRLDDGSSALEALVRDHLPPLDDIVALGHPQPPALTSIVLTLAAILLAAFRGVLDIRLSIVAVVTCYLSLLTLPIPISFDNAKGEYHWLAIRLAGLDADLGVTFVNYLMLATPALLTLGLLANLPSIRPMFRRARFVWSIALGVSCAASLLYVSPVWGPFASLLLMGVIAPLLDHIFRPRPLWD
jgi:hypothetical protein